jgi:hypothetical protein
MCVHVFVCEGSKVEGRFSSGLRQVEPGSQRGLRVPLRPWPMGPDLPQAAQLWQNSEGAGLA